MKHHYYSKKFKQMYRDDDELMQEFHLGIHKYLVQETKKYKRDGLTRSTFYKIMNSFQATNVLRGVCTPEEGLARVSEYMKIFDKEVRV